MWRSRDLKMLALKTGVTAATNQGMRAATSTLVCLLIQPPCCGQRGFSTMEILHRSAVIILQWCLKAWLLGQVWESLHHLTPCLLTHTRTPSHFHTLHLTHILPSPPTEWCSHTSRLFHASVAPHICDTEKGIFFKQYLVLAMSVLSWGSFIDARGAEWRHLGLSSLTRDRTCIPCTGRWLLNHWTFREVPIN